MFQNYRLERKHPEPSQSVEREWTLVLRANTRESKDLEPDDDARTRHLAAGIAIAGPGPACRSRRTVTPRRIAHRAARESADRRRR
jgi:hypothetical protein